MASARLNDVISHWNHSFDGMQLSAEEFYAKLEKAIESRQIPDASFRQIEIKEGGVMSAKRVYLRIWRKEHIFDVCGAPFGNGFFISWWLSAKPSGCLSFLLGIPVINLLTWALVRPITYFKLDTASMFQGIVNRAVMEVIDELTSAKGIRPLTEDERKPIMREFYQSR